MFRYCSKFILNRALKPIPPTSSGMQITIHKGPNDQTKRFVNSDNAQLQCNSVNFGDKKYIELQCPHCKAISVTFNVSFIYDDDIR